MKLEEAWEQDQDGYAVKPYLHRYNRLYGWIWHRSWDYPVRTYMDRRGKWKIWDKPSLPNALIREKITKKGNRLRRYGDWKPVNPAHPLVLLARQLDD